jgi:preprotein translocase subunit SecG
MHPVVKDALGLLLILIVFLLVLKFLEWEVRSFLKLLKDVLPLEIKSGAGRVSLFTNVVFAILFLLAFASREKSDYAETFFENLRIPPVSLNLMIVLLFLLFVINLIILAIFESHKRSTKSIRRTTTPKKPRRSENTVTPS